MSPIRVGGGLAFEPRDGFEASARLLLLRKIEVEGCIIRGDHDTLRGPLRRTVVRSSTPKVKERVRAIVNENAVRKKLRFTLHAQVEYWRVDSGS
jgi:hypothetical protein